MVEDDRTPGVVDGALECDGKFVARQRHGSDEMPARMAQLHKDMLDARTGAADGHVAGQRTLAELLARLGLARDAVLPASLGQYLPVGLMVVAPVSKQPRRSDGPVDDAGQHVAVLHVGCRSLPAPHELPACVRGGMEFVPVVAVLVHLRRARLGVLVGELLCDPVRRHHVLADLCLLLLGRVLDRCSHDGGAHELPAARTVAASPDLLLQGVEDGRRVHATLGQPLLEQPDGASIGDAQFVGSATEELEAAPVQQMMLGLLAREVVDRLEKQNAHHCLARVRRAPALTALRHLVRGVHCRGDSHEVRQLGHALQAARMLLQLLVAVVLDEHASCHADYLRCSINQHHAGFQAAASEPEKTAKIHHLVKT